MTTNHPKSKTNNATTSDAAAMQIETTDTRNDRFESASAEAKRCSVISINRANAGSSSSVRGSYGTGCAASRNDSLRFPPLIDALPIAGFALSVISLTLSIIAALIGRVDVAVVSSILALLVVAFMVATLAANAAWRKKRANTSDRNEVHQ